MDDDLLREAEDELLQRVEEMVRPFIYLKVIAC